jgi:hypothetical protein
LLVALPNGNPVATNLGDLAGIHDGAMEPHEELPLTGQFFDNGSDSATIPHDDTK